MFKRRPHLRPIFFCFFLLCMLSSEMKLLITLDQLAAQNLHPERLAIWFGSLTPLGAVQVAELSLSWRIKVQKKKDRVVSCSNTGLSQSAPLRLLLSSITRKKNNPTTKTSHKKNLNFSSLSQDTVIFQARASANGQLCCLILAGEKKTALCWFLAVRWPGHPYHWPRLGQTSKHHPQTPNPLRRRRRRISSCKMTGTALSGIFFFFVVQTQQKEAYQKNKIKTQPFFSEVDHCHCRFEELRFCSLSDQRGARKRRSTFCFFFSFPCHRPTFFLVLIRGWWDTVRPGGESAGFLRDLKVTSTWLTVSV